MKIVNLTQHACSEEQALEGVVNVSGSINLGEILTFSSLPTREIIIARARALADIVEVEGGSAAMIGGAPFFMAPLEEELRSRGIRVMYAFSERVSIETLVDGEVVKRSVFKHLGFVEA